MGREERRRAEREKRRRSRRSVSPPPPRTAERAAEPEVLGPVLRELDRRAGPIPPPRTPTKPAAVATPVSATPVSRPPAPPTVVPPDAVTTVSALRATNVGCGPVDDLDPQALGVTYTFDAAEDGEPYPLRVRFVGRRTGVTGEPGPQDVFDVVEPVARVVPGSGRVTLTRRIENIAAGEWTVAALPVTDTADDGARPMPALAKAEAGTGFAPIVRVRAPGVRIGAWPGLVGLGALVALTVQWLLAVRLGLPAGRVFVLSLVACLLGLLGARLYYVAEHPQRRRGLVNTPAGMCIQGFVLAAIATVVAGSLLLGLSAGTLVDVSAPGLMFGMAIGRVGCFLGGCCAGRPTGSRYGLWSSDRRLGVRRIPTQLFESALALVIGLVAAVVVATDSAQPGGTVLVAVIAAYTLGRQLLFPLRSLPRNTRYGRTLTIVACVLALVGAVAVALLS